MNAVLVRHTRVAVPSGTCYGWCEVPLAESWREDVAAVRANLPWTPLEVWTSPARRCRLLADGLAGMRSDPTIHDAYAAASQLDAGASFAADATEVSRTEQRFRLGTVRVVIEPRLRELGMGVWEGRRWDEFRGPESEAWALDPWRQRPPDGESGQEFWARVSQFRAEFLARKLERAVIVTHAGVIRAWRGLAEGRPLEAVMREPVPFGSIWPADSA